MTIRLECSKIRPASRVVRRVTAVRRATTLLALTAAMLLVLPAKAQEPIILTGNWLGTWWIGKYEEPIELDLTHTDTNLVGRVTLWGYPASGSQGAASPVRAQVTGTVEGHRVQLIWAMPEQGQFRAELTLLSRTRLFGLGGPGHITTGFELRRSE